MTRLRADALLLLIAVIWGTAFIAQKAGNEAMGPIAFVAVRFLFSAVALAPLALIEHRRQTTPPLSLRDIGLLVAIGLCLAAGAILQQVALVTATVTNAAFITTLYVVLVPFTTWILTRQMVRPLVLIACTVAIAGAWLLTTGGSGLVWTPSDIQLVISVLTWAFFISLIAIFLRHARRPYLMAFVQFAITALIAFPMAMALEPDTFAGVSQAMPELLYTSLLSGAFAFTLQALAQHSTPPAEAALIMSLESVVAAIAAALLLHERLAPVAMGGCALILAGVIAVEVGPAIAGRDRSRR